MQPALNGPSDVRHGSSMHGFAWQMPTDLRFGSGVSERIASDLAGRPCVVLAFDRAFEIGLQHAWAQRLGPALLGWIPAPHGPASLHGARSLAQRLWPLLQARPDAVLLGLGGGSVMDLAKLLRVLPEGQCFDKLMAAHRAGGLGWLLHRAELWLVPTTAGTGKEVLPWATLGGWCTLGDEEPAPDAVFAWAERVYVDPWLTSTCSAQVTLHAGLQALVNALTTLWSPRPDRQSEAMACDATRHIITKLPPLLQDLHDPHLRTELCRASMHAGMALPRRMRCLPQVASLPQRWAQAQGQSRAADELLQDVLGCKLKEGPKRLAGWLRELGVETHTESEMFITRAHEPVQWPSLVHRDTAPAWLLQSGPTAQRRPTAWT